MLYFRYWYNTRFLDEETAIHHCGAVGSTGTPALFYFRYDAPSRMTQLTNTRYNTAIYVYSHWVPGMFQVQSWRLVVGDEDAGVVFGARDQQCAIGTHDTLPWGEQEQALCPNK